MWGWGTHGCCLVVGQGLGLGWEECGVQGGVGHPWVLPRCGVVRLGGVGLGWGEGVGHPWVLPSSVILVLWGGGYGVAVMGPWLWSWEPIAVGP